MLLQSPPQVTLLVEVLTLKSSSSCLSLRLTRSSFCLSLSLSSLAEWLEESFLFTCSTSAERGNGRAVGVVGSMSSGGKHGELLLLCN